MVKFMLKFIRKIKCFLGFHNYTSYKFLIVGKKYIRFYECENCNEEHKQLMKVRNEE